MNLLISHAFLAKTRKLRTITKALALRGHAVLIDSGAFSNWGLERKGKPPAVHLPEYCDACISEYSRWSWGYIVLDKIGCDATTDANLEAMIAKGLKPIPVLQIYTDPRRMSDLVQINRRVAVAGAVKAKDKWISRRYREAMDCSGGQAKIHGLGYGRMPAVFSMPISTCDSSAAANGGQWGNFFLYTRTGGMKSYRRSNIGSTEPMRYLSRCNVPQQGLLDPGLWTRESRCPLGEMMTIAAYCAFHDHLMQLGIRYFFAVVSPDHLATTVAVYESMRPDGTFDYQRAVSLREEIEHGRAVPCREPWFAPPADLINERNESCA